MVSDFRKFLMAEGLINGQAESTMVMAKCGIYQFPTYGLIMSAGPMSTLKSLIELRIKKKTK